VFLFSGGLTVAYMLKLFVCLFVEKNPKMQAAYDSKTSYMTGLSKLVLGILAVILPMMGFFPGRTMDKMADMVMNFMRSGPMHHEVHYFTWLNLKGGFISIGIGLIVYFFVIRKVFMKNGNYVDLWPRKLDLEVLFSKLVWGMLYVLGWFARIMDGFLNEWCTVENLLKGLNQLAKIPERLPEAVIAVLKRRIYNETTERPELELVNKLHAQYDRKVDTLRLIGSSLSFGLLLACIGLIVAIIYLLMH
jgi:hydrogenase-4 component B